MIVLLAAILIAATTLAALRGLPTLAASNAVLMVAIPLLGMAGLTAGPLRVNAGALFFGAVQIGIVLKYRIFGRAEAVAAIPNILWGLATVFGAAFVIDQMGALPGWFALSARIVAASFIGFGVSQLVLILALDRCGPSAARAVMAIAAAQACDSVVFYPLAFGGVWTPDDLAAGALSGWVAKAAMGVMAWPALHYVRGASRRHIGDARDG